MKLIKHLTTIVLLSILLVGCSTSSTTNDTQSDNSNNKEIVDEITEETTEETVEETSSNMFTIVNSKLTDSIYGNRDFACVFTIQNNSSLTLEKVTVIASIIDSEGNVLSTQEGSTSARVLSGKTVDVTLNMNNEWVKGGTHIIADKIYYTYGDDEIDSTYIDYDEAMKYAIALQ